MIMTVSPTLTNLTSEKVATMKERWAFSESELADPTKCKSDDELVAYVDFDDGYGGTDGQQVIVYRNGQASNHYADGTAGVPLALALLAEQEESLLHTNGEDTNVWRDVKTNKAGAFVRFMT